MIFAHLSINKELNTYQLSNCNRLLVYQSEFKTENIKSFCRKPVELSDINQIMVLTSVLFITCFHKKRILNFYKL